MMLLIVVTDGNICAQPDGSAVRRQKLVDDFQDGRLSRTVVADDSHMFALFQIKGQVFKESEGAECLGQPFYIQHVVAALEFRLQCQVHIRADLHGFIQYFHFLQHLFTALRAFDRFFAVEGPKLFNHRFLMFDFLLLLQISVIGGGAEHFLFGGVGGVIAGKNGCSRIVQFNNLVRDPVKKIAVMGDDHHRAFIV